MKTAHMVTFCFAAMVFMPLCLSQEQKPSVPTCEWSLPRKSGEGPLRISPMIFQAFAQKTPAGKNPLPEFQANVQLRVTMNEAGRIVESCSIYSPNETLSSAAAETVSKWEFKPYLLNGKPIPIQSLVTLRFKSASIEYIK